MSGRLFLVPKRAFALFVVLIPGLGCLGIVLGSWMLPLIVALWEEGWSGVNQIPRQWYILAQLPPWIDPNRERAMFATAQITYGALLIAGAWLFGTLGARLWRFLVVKKFKWMTEEEVKAFEERTKKAPI